MVQSTSFIRNAAKYRQLHRRLQWESTNVLLSSSINFPLHSFSTTPTNVPPSSAPSIPTNIGIVMLNMGGPSSLDGPEDGVEPFLNRLFSDKEIIMLGPLQKWLVSMSITNQVNMTYVRFIEKVIGICVCISRYD